MIKITMNNYQEVIWEKEEFTDYRYDGKCFVIINGEKWVGIYDMDKVISITVKQRSW